MACMPGGPSWHTIFPSPPLERDAKIILEVSVGKIEEGIRTRQMGKREVTSVFSKVRFDILAVIRGQIDTNYVDVYYAHSPCRAGIPNIGERGFLAGAMTVSFLGEPVLFPSGHQVPRR